MIVILIGHLTSNKNVTSPSFEVRITAGASTYNRTPFNWDTHSITSPPASLTLRLGPNFQSLPPLAYRDNPLLAGSYSNMPYPIF